MSLLCNLLDCFTEKKVIAKITVIVWRGKTQIDAFFTWQKITFYKLEFS